jgi:hypothetical protein
MPEGPYQSDHCNATLMSDQGTWYCKKDRDHEEEAHGTVILDRYAVPHFVTWYEATPE